VISLTKKTDDKLECLLCPHHCKLSLGKTGICGVRKNTGEKVELTTYGMVSGYSLDPLEKKPLYHFFPGFNILSIGSYGCNMRCDFCQNYQISQNVPARMSSDFSIDKIIRDAKASEKNIGISFTYNEPVISFEFMKDIAERAKEEGLHTVMVSNGYVNKEPLEEIISFIDAFNIDLKAFNNDFYRKLTGADLEPVKNSLKQIARSGKHLEVTTLIIPGQNDNEKEMSLQTEWMASELGREIPFHISRYFPMYKRDNPSTPESSLKVLTDIAAANLDYVYTGNIQANTRQNTLCRSCGTLVTVRTGYNTRVVNLDSVGKCTKCGNQVYKYFAIS
jgi:pyruvate formate lyase activating enzyme